MCGRRDYARGGGTSGAIATDRSAVAGVRPVPVLIGEVVAARTVVGATHAPAMQPGIVRHSSPGIPPSHGEGAQSPAPAMFMSSLIDSKPALARSGHSGTTAAPRAASAANATPGPVRKDRTKVAHATKANNRRVKFMAGVAVRISGTMVL